MTALLLAATVPTTTYYLVLGAVLFGIGATGLMVRRNPLIMFMCVELMLNAVNLTFVARRAVRHDRPSPRLGDPDRRRHHGIDGQPVFFVLVVAAAEVVVGLGIIISILRRRPGATADDLAELEGTEPMLDVIWLIPAFPLAGFLLILVFGRRLGEPSSGYLASAMVLGLVRGVGRRLLRPAVDGLTRSCPRRDAVLVGARLVAPGRHGVPRRSVVDHDVPVRHRYQLPDPSVRDRVHARRPEVLEVLPVPQPVRACR